MLAEEKAVKPRETDKETENAWDIGGPVSSLVQLPGRVILVVVREASSRERI